MTEMAEVVGSSRSLSGAHEAPGASVPGDVAERATRVLASFWSLPEATCSIPEGVVTLVSGAAYFRRVERTFADLI